MTKQSIYILLFGSLFFVSSCATSQAAHIIDGAQASIKYTPDQKLTTKPGRIKPVIALIADNDGTETTDLIVPYGLIKDADFADIKIVSTKKSSVQLMPALEINADMTITEFDRLYPDGADLIIVPAMHHDDSAIVIQWIKQQYEKKSFVVSICEGAWLVARAGIFKNKKATTHWYALKKIAEKFPETTWVKNQRIVIDQNVMSTTGVTASVPAAIKVIELFAGHEKAQQQRQKFGSLPESNEHLTDQFKLSLGHMWTVTKNLGAFWNYESVGFNARDNFDEINLALSADAWSRTYKSTAYLVSPTQKVMTSQRGITFVINDHKAQDIQFEIDTRSKPLQVLTDSIDDIQKRYGQGTAHWVSDQLEYVDN